MPKPRVKVWDVYVRVTHWAFVATVLFAWWSAENDHMEWHGWAGYVALALVIFRIYWGLFGGSSALFSHFVRGPATVVRYAGGLVRGPGKVTLGHNPMGGWSVLALLTVLAAQVVSGLFAVDVDGIESGPLSSMVSFDQGRFAAHAHHWSFWALEALVVLHLGAVLFYLVRFRENLVGAMITGSKAADEPWGEPLAPAPAWRAALGIVIAASITILVARGFKL